MTRASLKTGDLNRLLKAAKAHGFVLEIEGERVKFLPSPPDSALAVAETTSVEKALAKWRRSV